MKTNEDGSVSFRITGKDGEVTEVNADLPGMNVQKKEDGSISFSKPEQPEKKETAPNMTPAGQTITTTRTTTTVTKMTQPSVSEQTIVTGQLSIPRSQNIKIKLPCPKHHQENLKTACQAPDGSAIPVKVQYGGGSCSFS
eukprot:sb/3474308/